MKVKVNVPRRVRRLCCATFGHHWHLISTEPCECHARVIITDRCCKCGRKRTKIIEEH